MIVFPAASCTVAVRTRFVPDTRSVVAPVSATRVAAPWTTVKAPRVPVVRPAAVASIVTEPTSAPVIVFVAAPPDAVAVPVPVTVPAPEALAKATTVVLSPVARLPAASRRIAVRTRLAPEVRLAVEPVSWICAAGPWTTENGSSVPVVRPTAVASMVTAPTSWPVIVLVATPFEAVAVPVPVTVPAPDAFENVTTVELSLVMVLPAASWIVAVRIRFVPEARSLSEPLSATLTAEPWTTVKAPRVPVVSPLAVACIVTEPTTWPVIVFVATPFDAVAVPVPATVPAPDCFENETTVVLSPVTVLPAASWIVAVRTRVVPEPRLAVEPVSAIWAAAPWTTVNAPSVPVVSPVAVASITTGPARAPVIVFVATPLEAVALPVPVTVPAPEALAKVTMVVLSEVTVLPAASRIVAVSTRVAPEVRSAVEPVRTMSADGPWTTVKAPRVPVVSPAEVASIVAVPTSAPVIVFVATPPDAVAFPVPVTVPAPEAFANATTVELSEVTVLPAASWIVAVSTRVAPEARSAVEPVSAIWDAAPWTTVNAPSVPVVSPADVASIVTEPTSWPVIVLVATPPRRSRCRCR